jgi:sarcosine oxidase, subunit beta
MTGQRGMPQPIVRGGPVVIIGGGVVGLSIAYHLAARGYRDVTLVERRTLGSGTTAKGNGGVRQQFSTAINIALSRRAVEYFETFAERVGEPITFRQHGYLFLLDREAQLTAFRASAAQQRAAGVPVEILEPADIPAVMPYVKTDGLLGASYCATDGSVVTADVVRAFANQARARGARLLEETPALAIERDEQSAVVTVRTPADRLEAEVVVNAAGAWAGEVARLVDVELPIEPHRRQAFQLEPRGWLTPDLPFTIDLGARAYVQPRPGGAVIGGNDRETPAGVDDAVDWSLTPALQAALAHRLPALAGAVIRGGRAGLRDMTPDEHAIVGPVAAVPGFWVAAGFSGHGFMHSPAIGDLLSQWLLEGAPALDLTALRLERFAEDAAIVETTVF